LPGWYNSQNDNSKGDPKKAPGIYSNVERYGTSWMFDLMRAREFAPQDLRPTRTIFGTNTTSRDARFNGATDGNHEYTPLGHASHDVGLALDLGVKDLISDANQKRTDQNKQNIATVANPGWSLANAMAWAGSADISNAEEKPKGSKLPPSNNFQQDALRDFLSLYQATREDLTSRILAGGGGAADRLKVQNALFRSDGQSTIPLVLFGDGSKNSYANVRSVLTNLGIKTTTSSGHQNHFHIYLKPPSLQAIVKPGGQNLLTNFEINEQINAATGDQTMMLDMNLPIPDDVLNPPALIAKVKVKFRDWGGVKASDEKGFKKVITSCTDVDGYADSLVIFDDVLAYLGYKADPETGVWSPPLEDKDLKFSVLQHPRHGTVGYGLLNGSSPETYGYLVRERKPDGTGAYQGPDRVVYLVEVKGQKFKVVINLLLGYSNDGPGGEVCVH
ncbi:MAG: hypothetical protein Q8Q84_10160, partial [Hydrogenophaga sp.]|nr:hypothetical protein [Hydrogenophaga sp.]